jgi:type I restriction enzyme S subunit
VIAVSGIGQVRAPGHWEARRLGALVRQRRETVEVVPGVEYKLLGVRWYGEGAFHRETVTTETSEATRLQPVRAGDLIYNRLFAWKGSFSIVERSLDGCFVSGEFPLFSARAGHDIRFVGYYLLQPWVWDLVAAESTGATAVSRNRWKEEALKNLVVPAPPYEEQKAVVDRLDELTADLRAVLTEFGARMPPEGHTLAELLMERRAALITTGVFGGPEALTGARDA